jgi:hypothetical protein
MTRFEVKGQKRGHDRAGSYGPHYQASQSIQIAVVQAEVGETLLPEDDEHDGERQVQQRNANSQELCQATLGYVLLVHPHHGGHSEAERDQAVAGR